MPAIDFHKTIRWIVLLKAVINISGVLNRDQAVLETMQKEVGNAVL